MKHLINNLRSCSPAPKTLAGKPAPEALAGKLLTPGHFWSLYSRSSIRNPVRNATPARSDAASSGEHSVAGGPRSTIGFTLVEVMVAIAVIAIGLTAVLGLLPGAIQSGRNAADNTLAATIVQDIFSNVRSTPFTLNNRACQYCALHDLPTFTGTDVPIHYDQEGNEINPASPTLNLQHYYLVTLQYTPQPTPPPPAALSIVTASIAWPANAPLTKQSKSTFVTEIAQYQ